MPVSNVKNQTPSPELQIKKNNTLVTGNFYVSFLF